MIDLFGIKARRLAKAQAEKQKYQERKERIDAYLTEYRKEEQKKASKEYAERQKHADGVNSQCPKCKSKNVIHHIIRTKGEIHGEGSSHFSSTHFLIGSSSSYGSHSRLDGKVDTLPVNKCQDCGNEWNIEKAEYPETENIFGSCDSHLLFNAINQYLEIKYDPFDKTEPYNSLEEKREEFCKRESGYYYAGKYRSVPRFILDYAVAHGGRSKFRYEEDTAKAFGFLNDNDEYSYIMPDKIWEIAKKIIRWEGNEE